MLQQPPVARIPCDDMFYAQLAYAGNDNHIYIKVQSEPQKSERMMLMARLYDEYTENPHSPIPLKEIVPKMYVVIKHRETYGDFFFRAQVIHTDDANVVHCFRIDEGSQVMVLPNHVYHITPQILKTEVLALKCYLDGLDIFDGLPQIKMAYDLVRMSELNPEPSYPSKVACLFRGTPVIRMLWKGGVTLTSAVQKWITYFSTLPSPMVGEEFQAMVVHVDSKGRVWLQPSDKMDFINRIQGTLQSFDYFEIPKAFGPDPSENGRFKPRKVEAMDAWKKQFFTVPSGVYISKFYKDNTYYRCILRRSINKEKVEVEFMDFGNVETVCRGEIFSCKDADENLAYIPPQCIKAHLFGVEEMNEDMFCKLINDTITVKVVQEEEDSEFGIGVEIYNWDSTVPVNQDLVMMGATTMVNKNRKHYRTRDFDYLM